MVPYKRHIKTVNRSPFIFCVARAQYEVRTFRRWFEMRKITEATSDTVLSYLQYQMPEGVAMHVKFTAVLPKPLFFTEDIHENEWLLSEFKEYEENSKKDVAVFYEDLHRKTPI